jgi:hypothetical protein
MNGCAVLGGDRGGDLADAMRAFLYAGGACCIGKLVAETLLHERFAAGSTDPSEVAGRAGVQRPLQDRQNGQRYGDGFPALLGLDRRNAVANVLAADPGEVAAAQAGIEDDVQPNQLAADNSLWIKALAELRQRAPREGYCYQHVQAIIVAVDQYAEAALGNRSYFLNKPYGIGGSKKGNDVPRM